ncbi:MAG: hypothetical protein KMY53_17925, partial [Desulfarculus sp.]|nr:hypothetical protein [Desulfarculus sp.]
MAAVVNWSSYPLSRSFSRFSLLMISTPSRIRLDELQNVALDRLIDSLAKFTERRVILDGAQELFAEWSKEYGPAMIFRRLWEKL